MKLNLLKASENEEHIKRHADSSSLTVGSKALKGVKEADVAEMLQAFDDAYADLIEKEGNPERRQFCLQCDRPVGTDAVVAKADLKKGTKIIPLIRDIGTPYETEVNAVLIDPRDMPSTSLVYGIYGPYGSTGNAGIYTMIYGDPGKPFPKKLEADAGEKVRTENAACEKYWQDHVFLCTPNELKSVISQMTAAGKDVSRQTAALLSFELKGSVSPLSRHAELQPEKGSVLLAFPDKKKSLLQEKLSEKQKKNDPLQQTVLCNRLQNKSY
ncbi:MAG: hypothetical protein ACI4TE_03805 [Alphaproteobacteria bacterium]